MYYNIKSNANQINEVCYPIIKIELIRFEGVFKFLSEEPVFVKILLDKKQEMKCLQQIFFMQKILRRSYR